MPLLFLGVVILVVGIFFLRRAIKEQDKEGIIGVTALVIAGVILILFYGIFYQLILP